MSLDHLPEGFEPAEVFPLAEYLCEEMIERGWTTDDVAVRMLTTRGAGMDAFIVAAVLSVHKDSLVIDDETFDGLARAFGVSGELFRNLDAAWRRWPAKRSPFSAPDSVFGPVVSNGLDAARKAAP